MNIPDYKKDTLGMDTLVPKGTELYFLRVMWEERRGEKER